MSTADAAAQRRRESLSFFRQSGWMMIATVVAGGLNSFVHTAAKEMPSREQYSLFATMLDTMALLSIPAGGLQGFFAQLAAGAVDEPRRRELRGAMRGSLRLSLLLWGAFALVLLFVQNHLARVWKADSVLILWVTLVVALVSVWGPIFAGLLQGRQNFLWLGNTQIAAGLGRLAAIVGLVLVLHALATGAMVGVLLGATFSLLVAAWAGRDLWRGEAAPFEAGPWLRRLIPVTLGLAAGSVMMSFDTPVVQAAYGDAQTAYYMAAGRIGRALVMFTTPVALVLFPRVARSAATGEKTGALKLALGAALVTGLGAALACTLFPELPLRILFAGQPDFLRAAPLVPWFAWCMLPLTSAYTLVNNLIARGRFDAVPWLVAVAAGYVVTLLAIQGHLATLPSLTGFRVVLGTLGAFSTLLLAVAIAFSLPRSSPILRP